MLKFTASDHSTAVKLVSVSLTLLIALLGLTACGEAAPDRSPIRVQALDVEGDHIMFADLADTNTVLWFWAPW